MKKIVCLIIMIFSVFLCAGCTDFKNDSKLKIVSTIFPGYDFSRAIVGNVESIEISMLLKPGSEVHGYEPSPKDIVNIKNCDLFIYVGGESDSWVDSLLDDLEIDRNKVIKMMDYVDLVYEETIDGMDGNNEDEQEFDEHVWTSPINAIKIINAIYDKIIKIDENNKEKYKNNMDNYVLKIKDIDSKIRDVVNNSSRKEIVFGDRFPFRYFVDEYGLSYSAAFPGCADATEASAKTISYLVDKVKNNNIPVVFKIELSNGNIADTISSESGALVRTFNSVHNISVDDFKSGKTYVDFMNDNIAVLKEAIN